MRSALATLAAIILGISLLWIGTDGFRAFTSEGARRLAIQEKPREMPNVQLQDTQGQRFHLQDYNGKLVLLTFFYSGCTDVCPIVETNFQEIYKQLPQQYLGKDVVLLSISFDPDNDTPEKLHSYSHYFQVDGVKWRMATVTDKKQLKELLDTFGVLVIPDGKGGYEHNAAFYMINRQGKITQIFDYDKPDQVVDSIKTIL